MNWFYSLRVVVTFLSILIIILTTSTGYAMQECLSTAIYFAEEQPLKTIVLVVQKDGTVYWNGVGPEDFQMVRSWKNIKAVSTAETHAVGLKQDGTVVAVGSNQYGQCNVADWHDITQVVADLECTYGLTTDGKIIYVGEPFFDDPKRVLSWENIQQIDVNWDVVAVTKDGQVKSTVPIDLSAISNAKQVATDGIEICILTLDGEVLFFDTNTSFAYTYQNIVEITYSGGTVRALGKNGQIYSPRPDAATTVQGVTAVSRDAILTRNGNVYICNQWDGIHLCIR